MLLFKSEHVGCTYYESRWLEDPSLQDSSLTGFQQKVQKDAAKVLWDKYMDSSQELWEMGL